MTLKETIKICRVNERIRKKREYGKNIITKSFVNSLGENKSIQQAVRYNKKTQNVYITSYFLYRKGNITYIDI